MSEIKELKNLKMVKVDGKDYSLQKLPIRQALELREKWQVDGTVHEPTMYDLVLEHIVVNPKVTMEDFGDDVIVLEELIGQALNYQYKTKGK